MSDTLINRLRGIYDASNGEFEARDFSAFIPPISLEAANAIESLEADKALLTAKVKELEVNLELAISLLGDGEHSFYLNG